MDKKNLGDLRQILEKEKIAAEDELKKFAEKDKTLSGDWDTKFPKFNGANLEDNASEVEEYGNLLPLEYNLELRLKYINKALEKIKGDRYGKCEKCAKEIPPERLLIYPAARFCMECEKK